MDGLESCRHPELDVVARPLSYQRPTQPVHARRPQQGPQLPHIVVRYPPARAATLAATPIAAFALAASSNTSSAVASAPQRHTSGALALAAAAVSATLHVPGQHLYE